MAGSNKVWRAPVAGLASVAMLATLGVSAMTANAADVTYDVTLHANGGTFGKSVNVGGSITSADANTIVFEYTTTDTANPETIGDVLSSSSLNFNGSNGFITDTVGGGDLQMKGGAEGEFTGWYSAEGASAAYNPDAPLVGDVDLYAHFTTNPVDINFDGAYVANSDAVTIASADYVADWQIPSDRSATDHKTVAGWTSKDGGDELDVTGMTGKQLTDAAGQAGTSSSHVWLKAVSKEANVITFKTPAGGFYTNAAGSLRFGDVKEEVATGDVIPLPTVYYAGFSFRKTVTSWKLQGGEEVFPVADWNKTASNDLTFVPAESSIGYTVNFYYNKEENTGSKLLSTQHVGESSLVSKPADPTRDGYTFNGWVDKNGKAWDFDKYTVEPSNTDMYGVLNLFATWTKSAAAVTFYTNSDDMDATITKSFADGDKFEAPEVTRDGYVLIGWYEGTSPWANEVTYFGKTLKLVKFGNADDVKLQIAMSTSNGNTGVKVRYVDLPTKFYAQWKRADEKAVSEQEAVTPAKLLYKDGNSKNGFLTTSKYFTTKSFNEFTDWYDSTYLKTKAEMGSLSNAEAAKLVTMLKEAQSKLVFKTDVTVYRFEKDGKHIYAQGEAEYNNLLANGWKRETLGDFQTVDTTGLPQETIDGLLTTVSRLREKASGQYMLTADQNEINVLGDAWKNETASAIYTPKNGTVPVYRLYLRYNGEHLVTADANEYDTQIKDANNFHGDGIKFYIY